MKKLKFQLFHSKVMKRVALPIFLLVGLLLGSTSVVSAQLMYSDDASSVVRQELSKVSDAGTSVSATAKDVVSHDFYSTLVKAVRGTRNSEDTNVALNEVFGRLSSTYVSSYQKSLLLTVRDEARQLLTD